MQDLANAQDDEAFRLWQGLGYYARCRNMLATARQIVSEYGGHFPNTYEGLLHLKGIGPYTAAAIASFAYGLPHAVVDGNVYRVLARYFGITTPTDGTEGKKLFQQIADHVLDSGNPGGFNQAMMDHGATVCTPALPRCGACPVAEDCVARAEGLIDMLPVRGKKAAVRTRYFHYLLLHCNGSIWIRLRSSKDIWKGLYEPMLIEAHTQLDRKGIAGHEAFRALNIPEIPEYEGMHSQRLTHQIIESRFFSVHTGMQPVIPVNGSWIPIQQLQKYPFPRTLVIFFEKKGYF